jgi:hypothetical protein
MRSGVSSVKTTFSTAGGLSSPVSALAVGVLACALAVAALASAAAGTDLHRLWDDRCAECHGHAGDFARKHLLLVDGTLQGRSIERELHQFLANHYPGDADVDDIHCSSVWNARSTGRERGCERTVAALRDYQRFLDAAGLAYRLPPAKSLLCKVSTAL